MPSFIVGLHGLLALEALDFTPGQQIGLEASVLELMSDALTLA